MSRSESAEVQVAEFLEDTYPNSVIKFDVQIEPNITADIVVERDYGIDIAFNVVSEQKAYRHDIKDTLLLQFGGYKPTIVTPFNSENGAMDEGSVDYKIAETCSRANVGLVGQEDGEYSYVLHPLN